ncbi:hypothetical protein BC833DRAFT_564618 [Globomyces pollinis-pini]|nr:hypothetical protein BC833DRAFT_564618 [Globomyces pollinis-pini]
MVTFLVLRCCQDDCKLFQVQQKKKVQKWTCSVCGTRQSTMQIYLASNAQDCRILVQEKNYDSKFNCNVRHQSVLSVIDEDTQISTVKKTNWDKYAQSDDESDFTIVDRDSLKTTRKKKDKTTVVESCSELEEQPRKKAKKLTIPVENKAGTGNSRWQSYGQESDSD